VTNSNYRQKNEAAWDRMARQQNRLAKPAREKDFVNPLETVDGCGWLGGDIRGKTVLCLAAGGGRQGPIYAAAGAIVTVVDISEEMLNLDRIVADEKHFTIHTIKASMDRLTNIDDRSFDIVIHPVSTCYVHDISAVFGEVARVIRPNGLYVSQHKTPTSLQASLSPSNSQAYELERSYYSDEPLPSPSQPTLIREPGTQEFIHRWEQIVGGICRAGFAVEDLSEPNHGNVSEPLGSFGHRSAFVAPYVRIKARRLGESVPSKIVLS
jgi:ubiquinone/menaquinone biosynthesis C-methylase UbiE